MVKDELFNIGESVNLNVRTGENIMYKNKPTIAMKLKPNSFYKKWVFPDADYLIRTHNTKPKYNPKLKKNIDMVSQINFIPLTKAEVSKYKIKSKKKQSKKGGGYRKRNKKTKKKLLNF